MFVRELMIYPLTGARGVDVEQLEVCPGRVVSGDMIDRQFVCYDPETGKRVSSKTAQAPRLAKVEVRISDGVLVIAADDRLYQNDPKSQIEIPIMTDSNLTGFTTQVSEFEDTVPVYDMGDNVADFLSKFLGKETRLAQKSPEWLNQKAEETKKRGNALLHIVSQQSVLSMFRQLRANVLLDLSYGKRLAKEDFPESEWEVGDCLSRDYKSGGVEIVRHTVRCDVTGRDHSTGEKSDYNIPLIFNGGAPQKYVELADGSQVKKAIIGVYGALAEDEPVKLEVGQALHLFSATS
jgi:uncharacterized protein YcbX